MRFEVFALLLVVALLLLPVPTVLRFLVTFVIVLVLLARSFSSPSEEP